MNRAFIFIACCFFATVSYAEVMGCDRSQKCSLVCYFPSTSARTEHVYPANGVAVDRVRVEAVGNDNLLYTAERIDRSGTMPIYHPLEAFILPKDYPCRFSPVELREGGGSSTGNSGLVFEPTEAKPE